MLAHGLLPLLPSLGHRRPGLEFLEPRPAGRVFGFPFLFTSQPIPPKHNATDVVRTFSNPSPMIIGQSQYHGTNDKSA